MRPFLATLVVCVATASTAAQEQARTLGVADAVRITLAHSPEIKIAAESVEAARGDLTAASGAFDTSGTAALNHQHDNSPLSGFGAGSPIAHLVTDTTAYRGSVVQPFRSGPTVGAAMTLTRSDANVSPVPANYATATLSLIQPLARGRGAVAKVATEKAARIDVDASTSTVRHVAAERAFQTLTAYWRYVAADRRLGISHGAEARAQQLVEETEALVAAGNRPSADTKQVRGLLAERRSARIQAEQERLESQIVLGLAMGLDVDQLGSLPPPSDSFPDTPAPTTPLGLATAPLVQSSVGERLDLRAARQREQAASERVRSAADGLKPRIDFVGSLGYAGIGQGASAARYFGAFLDPVAGANVSASLVYEWPGANRSARGELLRTEAGFRQAQLETANLARDVAAGVTLAVAAVERSRERVRLARGAADLYRSALDDEKTKLQIGLATIIDQIVTEDRLTQSLIDGVSAEASHAEAIAELRFATGTLIEIAGDKFIVDRARLTTVPAP